MTNAPRVRLPIAIGELVWLPRRYVSLRRGAGFEAQIRRCERVCTRRTSRGRFVMTSVILQALSRPAATSAGPTPPSAGSLSGALQSGEELGFEDRLPRPLWRLPSRPARNLIVSNATSGLRDSLFCALEEQRNSVKARSDAADFRPSGGLHHEPSRLSDQRRGLRSSTSESTTSPASDWCARREQRFSQYPLLHSGGKLPALRLPMSSPSSNKPVFTHQSNSFV